MVIKGTNIIITAGGVAIAASKSCTIDTKVSTIETASPDDGEYKHFIADRKSWSLSTSHLVFSGSLYDGLITAVSKTHTNMSVPASYFIINGRKYIASSRGFHIMYLDTSAPYTPVVPFGSAVDTPLEPYLNNNKQPSLKPGAVPDSQIFNDDDVTDNTMTYLGASAVHTFDTWTDSTRADVSKQMVDFLSSIPSGHIVAINTCDAVALTDDIKQALIDLGADVSSIATGVGMRLALSIIAWKGNPSETISMSSTGNGATATARSYVINNQPFGDQPVKSMLQRTGVTYAIQIRTQGYPLDTLRGNVICTDCKITATRGNLAQGSFSFQGTGPLV